MNWLQQWKAFSARIQGLLDAASFFYSTNKQQSGDDKWVRKKILLPNAKTIFSDLEEYLRIYKHSLPKEASMILKDFLENPDIKEIDFEAVNEQVLGHVQLALTSLAAFRSEFSYIIADNQAIALKITERAFTHLKRSIMVDQDIRKKWISAYENGEIQCERLGALHLLSHGIWAFKVDAEKGRTDLVLNEPISDIEIIEKTSTALVLTEWKIVENKNEINKRIDEAHKQTELYTAGVLGGIELTDYRYLVMVSEKSLDMPPDYEDKSIIYRHINIPVKPSTPSRESRL